MSSTIDRKERINRLKNYVNQIPISVPSIKFELIEKIEKGKLTSSSDINNEIEKIENYMRSTKKSRPYEKIKEKTEKNITKKFTTSKEKEENIIPQIQSTKDIKEKETIDDEEIIYKISTTNDKSDEESINKFVFTFDTQKFSKKRAI
ncbi:hypothetical protein [Methanobrevibacter ruminantium]|uniref:hypothetical protein n=1 Tax=Methanobrevibacter ruminantium TaxID=83816 RepID=UPI0026ECD451|nr:hypothetical protein [Methanobrevibacter ruminantium]